MKVVPSSWYEFCLWETKMMEIDTDKMVDVAGDKGYELVIDWSAVERDPRHDKEFIICLR